jgi:4-hydroxy-tetrahydrodipicolinate synthase
MEGQVNKVRGIIPALVTPFEESGEVSERGLRELIKYVIGGGVQGIFVTGTTGEFYGLSIEQRRQIYEIAKEEAKGKVAVYAGANGITTKEAIHLSQVAEASGVDAVSVLTPMFINPSQQELIAHYKSIAANTGLPIIIYNNPPKTSVHLEAGSIAILAEEKNIVGVKDSSGDMTVTAEYIRQTAGKDFAVLVGRDTLIYGALCYGAAGSIAACANVAPRICVDIYERYQRGDLAGALQAQNTLAPLRLAFSLGTFPAVIKEALKMLGIAAGQCMAPVGELSREQRNKLREVLEAMGLIPR